MINLIITGIAQALAEAFPGAEIYQEAVHQDFKEPCFFIQPLSVSRKDFIGGRRQLTCPVTVIYFPGSQDTPCAEIAGVGAKLFPALGSITATTDDLVLRGSDLHFETVDGVLHFFATYTLFLVPISDKEPMGEFAQATRIKGE